jgi:hypothetical protein
LAARSLVLGNAARSDRQAHIRASSVSAAPKTHDAPNWVRVNCPRNSAN